MFSAGVASTWNWGARGLLSGCRTRRTRLSPRKVQSTDADIGARLSELPIANGAVDAVVCPYLEFETDPMPSLQKRIGLAGEDPSWSSSGSGLWPLGIPRRAISRGYPPGLKRMLGAGRIADWLELLGYDVSLAQLSVHAALGGLRAPMFRRPCCVVAGNPGPRVPTSSGTQASVRSRRSGRRRANVRRPSVDS